METDKLSRLNQQRKADEKAGVERFNDSSRNRFLKIMEKKLTTCFIGSLSKFETWFGDLWGHSLCDEERTPEQRELYERWSECRTEVLNNGNNQKRALQTEILQYTMHWNRYQLNLPVLKEDGNV